MALTFPPSPTTGQQYQNWVWDGTKWAPAPVTATPPSCGLFMLGSANPSTSVKFVPHKGDQIKINGSIYQIPAAGISAVYNNAYINGVLGTLVGSTVYYVYVWNSGSGLALDFSTTSHATSSTPGNVGVEIKNGDDTRSLVGIVYTGATTTPFYDDITHPWIRSWFNRHVRVISNYYAINGWSIGTMTEVGVVSFIGFAGENIAITCAVGVLGETGSATAYLNITVDHVALSFQAGIIFAATYTYSLNNNAGSMLAASGLHTVGIQLSVNGGSVTFASQTTSTLGV